jgi:hypothetical protein
MVVKSLGTVQVVPEVIKTVFVVGGGGVPVFPALKSLRNVASAGGKEPIVASVSAARNAIK